MALMGTAYVDVETIEQLHENLGDEVLVTVAVGPRPNHWYIAVWIKRADLAPYLFPDWKSDPMYRHSDLQRGGA